MRAFKARKMLSAVVLVIVAAAAVTLWRANAATVVSAGVDQFQTPANATSFEPWNLPDGFFTNAGGSTSNAVSTTVYYKGGDPVPGYSADTVIRRVSDVTVPGSTALSVVGIRFLSTSTVPVTFHDGSTVNYSISVKESGSVSSGGTMNLYADNSFDNTLDINREYTCTAAGQPTKTFDSAALGWDPVHLSGEGTWALNPPGFAAGSFAAVARGGVTIKPNSEQSVLQQHGLVPPSPSPTPTPTMTQIGIDAQTSAQK